MTRSIFDPSGGETERSGSTFLGPSADNISHLPPDVTDGETGAAGVAEAGAGAEAGADELATTPATDSAEAARRLGQMTSGSTGAAGADQPLDEMPPPLTA